MVVLFFFLWFCLFCFLFFFWGRSRGGGGGYTEYAPSSSIVCSPTSPSPWHRYIYLGLPNEVSFLGASAGGLLALVSVSLGEPGCTSSWDRSGQSFCCCG